jgi:hypothetical protein
MSVTHPDIDDPTFRRRLADIVHDAVQLTDAVERAIPCDFDRDLPWQCWRSAAWIARLPCGCPQLFCDVHKLRAEGFTQRAAVETVVHCARCDRQYGTPVPISFERI